MTGTALTANGRTVAMKKLIELDAALDAIGKVPDYDDGMVFEALSHAQRDVALLPPVDAVPVVRCRDCEHKDRESGFCHGRGWPMQLVPDDGFCDKGKGR